MKFKSKYIIVFLILLFCTNIYAQTNKILFKVNNEIITSLDLLEEIRLLKIINAELNNLEADRIYEIAKNSLFRQKIKNRKLHLSGAESSPGHHRTHPYVGVPGADGTTARGRRARARVIFTISCFH